MQAATCLEETSASHARSGVRFAAVVTSREISVLRCGRRIEPESKAGLSHVVTIDWGSDTSWVQRAARCRGNDAAIEHAFDNWRVR